MVKNLPANAGDIRDVGSIPGSGRSPGGGHGNPLLYSSLENPMERGAWQTTVHGVAESDKIEVTQHAHKTLKTPCTVSTPNSRFLLSLTLKVTSILLYENDHFYSKIWQKG